MDFIKYLEAHNKRYVYLNEVYLEWKMLKGLDFLILIILQNGYPEMSNKLLFGYLENVVHHKTIVSALRKLERERLIAYKDSDYVILVDKISNSEHDVNIEIPIRGIEKTMKKRLSFNDFKVYLFLIKLNGQEFSQSKLSLITGIHQGNISRTMDMLRRRGLILLYERDKENNYRMEYGILG